MALEKGRIAWLIVGVLTGVIAVSLFFTLNDRLRPAPIYISPPAPTAVPAATETPGPARVFVSGEVRRPAVYELSADGIIRDAVEAAGGFTDSASRDVVNLALPLMDGMHVHVPAADEVGAPPAVSYGSEVGMGSGGDLIDINSATLEELDTLPGIGPAIGQRIIDYRTANGPFSTIDELMNVSGIGPAKFEQIKELIYIQ